MFFQQPLIVPLGTSFSIFDRDFEEVVRFAELDTNDLYGSTVEERLSLRAGVPEADVRELTDGCAEPLISFAANYEPCLAVFADADPEARRRRVEEFSLSL